MSTQLDLKAIERKAFLSTYQDGLWDIYYGVIVVCMSVFLFHPESGYSPLNIILMSVIFFLAYGLFWAGKKFITLPRLGQVRFGAARKKKGRTLAIVLGMFVLLQAALVGVTSLGWFHPEAGAELFGLTGKYDAGRLVVACIGALMVGPSMIVIAFFQDFLRGYYIAILMGLAVFLMIYINQPVFPVVIGGLIILPGVVHFLRFLKMYPLNKEGAHE